MGSDHSTLGRVLFVCTGNTCRSVLAEYLGREVFGDTVLFESAGIRPQPATDAANAVYTLKKNFNIDASSHVPRNVRAVNLDRFDLIIGLDREAPSVAQEIGAPESKLKLWRVRDPCGDDLTAYDRASLEIKKKLVQLKMSPWRSRSKLKHC